MTDIVENNSGCIEEAADDSSNAGACSKIEYSAERLVVVMDVVHEEVRQEQSGIPDHRADAAGALVYVEGGGGVGRELKCEGKGGEGGAQEGNAEARDGRGGLGVEAIPVHPLKSLHRTTHRSEEGFDILLL